MARAPKCAAAAEWLATQSWFAAWRMEPSYRANRQLWRQIADAVRDAGYFSPKTSTIDIPVVRIVNEAMAIRARRATE